MTATNHSVDTYYNNLHAARKVADDRQLAARDGNVTINSTYQPYRRNPRLSKVSGSYSYIYVNV